MAYKTVLDVLFRIYVFCEKYSDSEYHILSEYFPTLTLYLTCPYLLNDELQWQALLLCTCSGKGTETPEQRRKCPNAVIVKTNLLQILRLKNIKLQSMDTNKIHTFLSLSLTGSPFHPLGSFLEYWLLVVKLIIDLPWLGLVYLKLTIPE